MPLDSICISALVKELDERTRGAQIDKIHQPSSDTVIFVTRSRTNGSGKLILCGRTGAARVHYTEGRYENPAAPPMFCMMLRKHLSGARIAMVNPRQTSNAKRIIISNAPIRPNSSQTIEKMKSL